MLGVREELLRGLIFLDPALIDEDDSVGHLAGKAHLVGDHQHGDAGVGQLLHQLQHLADHLRVEGGGGLVEQDDIRVHGQSAGNGNALLLAAGKALGEHIGFIGQADTGQQLLGTLGSLLLALELEQLRGQAEVLLDGQVGEEVEVLEHHAHLLAHGIDVGIIHLDALKLDGAAGGDLQSVQAAQEGRLAAAGGADQADHIAAVDVDVDALQDIQGGGGLLCALFGLTAVGLGQTTDFQDLFSMISGHLAPSSSQTSTAAM